MTDPGDARAIRDILDFWFLPLSDPGHGKPRPIWWESTAEFDGECRSRFADLIDTAIAGELDSWRQSPDGALTVQEEVPVPPSVTRGSQLRTSTCRPVPSAWPFVPRGVTVIVAYARPSEGAYVAEDVICGLVMFWQFVPPKPTGQVQV